MVLSQIATNLINRFLSPFVDELTANQLNVFAWSGQVSLDNVSVKSNAFDVLKLPFRVVHGHIGKIEASVPWMNIYTEPIVINISDVFVLAIPNNAIEYDEEEEKKNEWAIKKKILENIEDAKQKIKDDFENNKPDDGFFMKMIVAAVKNIQIFVNNLHICYEDCTSFNQHEFQVGLSFSRLVFETASFSENKNQKSNDNLINKLVKLEGFSLYLNFNKFTRLYNLKPAIINEILKDFICQKTSKAKRCHPELQYILCPINFFTETIIHRKPEADSYKLPIIDIDMKLDLFHIQLTSDQVKALLLLLDSIDRMKKAAPFRKWRPNVPIKDNPKAWWKFLYTSINETGTLRRKREFSWENIEKNCKNRKLYLELYKKKLLGENVGDLTSLEQNLSLTAIVMDRAEAEFWAKPILESRAIKNSKNNKGWFGGWFGGSSNEKDSDDDSMISNLKKEFTPVEKNKLYKAIGYDEHNLLTLYPPDFIGHCLKFKISKFKISLQSESSELLDIEFLSSRIEIYHRPSSSNFLLVNELDSLTIMGKRSILILKSKIHKEFLSLKFEMNPLDKQCDFAIDMNMSSLNFIYDIDTINQLVSLFVPSENISLEEIQTYAQFKLGDLKQRTALGIEYAIEKHKQLKINISIEPSFVVVPKLGNITHAQSVLILSLGKFLLNSKLVPKSNIPKVKDMMGKDKNYVFDELKKMIYEKYTIQIKNVQMILSDKKHWKGDLELLDTERHILCPFEINVNFDRSIIQADSHFPRIVIFGDIPVIELKASDAQISQLLILIVTLPFGPNSKSNVDNISSIKNSKLSSISINTEVTDAYNYATNTITRSIKEKKEDMSNRQNLKTVKIPDVTDGLFDASKEDQIVIYKDVSFEFHIKNIYLTIFQNDRNLNSSLCRLNLVKLVLMGEILIDQTLWINCLVADLRIDDIRHSRKNTGIITMVQKSRNSKDESVPMLTVYMAQKNTERVVVTTLSGISLILALEYLLALIEVSQKAFTLIDETKSIATVERSHAEAESNVKKPKAKSIVNILEFDSDKMEVIMVDSLDVLNTEACVFTCLLKVKIRLEEDQIQLTGIFPKVTMSLANYRRYCDSGEVEAYIMSPTELNVGGTIKGTRQLLHFTFNDIYITISPQMVNIIVTILSKIGTKTETKSNEPQKVVSISELLKPKPINPAAWYLNCVPVANEALNLIKDTEQSHKNNQLLFTMNSIKILFTSGGSSAHPLIRIPISLNAKLIGNKEFIFDCSLLADYYNQSLLSWEPLIEQVNGKQFLCKGKLDLLDYGQKIYIETLQRMEVLLSNSSINVLYKVAKAFSNAFSHTKSVGTFDENRIVIRNYLGIDLSLSLLNCGLELIEIENESLANKNMKNATNILLQNGKVYHFKTSNMARIELNVNIIFSPNFIVNRTIVCKNSSVRCFFTSLKTYPVNENWKWVVQVHDTGSSTKEIIFRSNTQVVNNFDASFLLYSHDKEKSTYIGKLDALSNFYLPLHLVYGEEFLYIRPSEEFELSDNPVNWRSLNLSDDPDSSSCMNFCTSDMNHKSGPRYLIIGCLNKVDNMARFNVKVRGERFNVLYEDTEKLDNDESYIYSIKLIPFVRLKNLLPYAIEFTYDPINEFMKLESGEESNLPHAVFGQSSITYKLLDYQNKNWIAKEIIPSTGLENETKYYLFKDIQGSSTITLAVNFSIEKSSLALAVFCPYWMVNRTNENLCYQIDSNNIYRHCRKYTEPYLLCLNQPKFLKKPSLSISIANSFFSEEFPMDVVPYNCSVLPQVRSKRYSYCINVKVELSRIGLSKICTISSFYTIMNISKQQIDFSENNEDWASIPTETSLSFFPTRSSNQSICFRFSSNELSSKHVSLRESSQTLLLIHEKYLFVEVDITELEANIKISDYFEGASPVLIINDLNRSIFYGQRNVTKWEMDKERYIKLLPSKNSVYFCWIEPIGTRELVFKLNCDDCEHYVNLDFDKYTIIDNDIGWVSFLDGKQRVLLFTRDQNLPKYLLNMDELTKPNLIFELVMKGYGLNIVDNEKRKDLLYMNINSTYLWEARSDGRSNFKTLSIKENDLLESLYQSYLLQNNDPRSTRPQIPMEKNDYQVDFSKMVLLKPRFAFLRRASNRGLWFYYSTSEHIKQYHIKISRIQIDNQLSDHIFDVALCPVIVPKSVADKFELEQKSFIELSAIIHSQGSIIRYKYVQILIQEFLLQLDWGWIIMIMNVFNFEPSKDESNKVLINRDIQYMMRNDIVAEMQKFVMRKTYYDYLLLGPLKVHLSVAVGDLPDGKFPFGLDFIIRFTGLTVGEINDTLFKLDYFERKMVFMCDSELINQIIDHYKTQAFMQFYKLILGLDIIGNPMKLALGIKKGIGDFFYEPAVGIIHGPEEFAEGIANGFKSLATNVLGGTAGALGRIGNRLGTGVAALTVDDKFQKERRERINRKNGFTEGGKNLLRGFMAGLTGVVTKPIEGAKQDGVEGLFKGVGRGVVGIVAQPATGVIDFATGSLQAFNNVIDSKHIAKPSRPPRYFKPGREITAYTLQMAIGNQILKNLSEGKYASEEYEFHMQTSPGYITLMTTGNLFFLKKSMLSSNWDTEFVEPWSNCQRVVFENKKVRIHLKESKKAFLLFGNVNEHTITVDTNDKAKILCARIIRHLNQSELVVSNSK